MKYTSKKTEEAIKNEQYRSRDTGNDGHTRNKTKTTKHKNTTQKTKKMMR